MRPLKQRCKNDVHVFRICIRWRDVRQVGMVTDGLPLDKNKNRKVLCLHNMFCYIWAS